MSGRQFVDTLVQLGYPKADSLDAQSFDWMFEGDEVVSFLDCFCNNVGTTNILDPKELQEYERLRDSEEGVLQGSQLEEALRSVTVGEEDNLTDDQLRKAISQAEHDLEIKKKRKQVLIQKRNKLSLHQTSLSHQLFLTFNGLVEGARQLKSESDAAQHTLMSTAVRHDNRLNLLESNLTTCLDLVYAGSSTTSGQPTLTPRQLLDSMTTLENLIKKLEQSIKDVVKELESKKQTLRNDPLLHKERKMFSYFFNNPAHMKQLFDELSSQLQAHRVN